MDARTGFLVYLLCLVIRVNGQSCTSDGLIGDNREQETSRNVDNFYLNVNSPATCGGMITGFSYSFFAPLSSPPHIVDYVLVFAVYRQTSVMNNMPVYTMVSESYMVAQPALMFLHNSQQSHFSAYLSLSNPLPVEAGDVIGACVTDPPYFLGEQIFRLDVVGTSSSNDDELMVGSPNGCGYEDALSSVTSLNRQTGLILHIHADIEPHPGSTQATPGSTQATPGSTQATPGSTTAPTTIGTPVSDTTTMGEPFTSDTGTGQGTTPTTVGSDGTTMGEPFTSDMGTGQGTTPPPNHTDTDIITTQSMIVNNSNPGVAIAVVIVVAVLLITILALVVAVIFLVKKRKTSYDISSTNPASFQGTKINALSQPMYEFEDMCASTSFNNSDGAYAEVGPPETDKEAEANSRWSPVILSYAKLLEKNRKEDIYASENPYETPANQENEIYAQLKAWDVNHIHPEEIEIVGHLGSGQFGSVEQGVWKRQGTRPVDVALKSLTKTSEEDKVKFLQEAAIMAQFRHPNVIKLHGVVIRGAPMRLVTELAVKGDLRVCLFSMMSPGEVAPAGTAKALLQYSQQVALGMQYLSAKGFVHRDLAARNVLVTSRNICKVADFGLSRNLEDENYYFASGNNKIPVKWTAPEAIHYKKYSTASDVWAYGCLLYEIWSLGHKPFTGLSNIEAVRLADSGQRLPPPPGCPKIVYQLMIACWHPETSQRPSFRDIVLALIDSEEVVLNIPEEDSSTNPLAGVLGAPLEAGENMYSELQRKYLIN